MMATAIIIGSLWIAAGLFAIAKAINNLTKGME